QQRTGKRTGRRTAQPCPNASDTDTRTSWPARGRPRSAGRVGRLHSTHTGRGTEDPLGRERRRSGSGRMGGAHQGRGTAQAAQTALVATEGECGPALPRTTRAVGGLFPPSNLSPDLLALRGTEPGRRPAPESRGRSAGRDLVCNGDGGNAQAAN